MNTRAKYLWGIGHYVAGHPENMEKVDEAFLRSLEEQADIREREVESWRRMVYDHYLQGRTHALDAKLGLIFVLAGDKT